MPGGNITPSHRLLKILGLWVLLGLVAIVEAVQSEDPVEFLTVDATIPTSVLVRGAARLSLVTLTNQSLQPIYLVTVHGGLRPPATTSYRATYRVLLSGLERPECLEVTKEAFKLVGGREEWVGRFHAKLDPINNRLHMVTTRPQKPPEEKEEEVKRPLVFLHALPLFCESWLAGPVKTTSCQLLVAPHVEGFRLFHISMKREPDGSFQRPGDTPQAGRRISFTPDLGFLTFLAPTASAWYEPDAPHRFLAARQPKFLWLPEIWTYITSRSTPSRPNLMP